LVERPATVEESFSQQAPLVYHFGHVGIQKNLQMFNMVVSRAAEVVLERVNLNKKSKGKNIDLNT
jgi:polyribonucleotide 5'-hydroxyl-kinase